MRFLVIGWFTDDGLTPDTPTEVEVINAAEDREAKAIWRRRLAANGGQRQFDYLTTREIADDRITSEEILHGALT